VPIIHVVFTGSKGDDISMTNIFRDLRFQGGAVFFFFSKVGTKKDGRSPIPEQVEFWK